MDTKKVSLENIKRGAVFLCSVGAGLVIGNVIKATTPEKINIIKKCLIGAGGLTLSSMVGDKAGEYAEGVIDELSEEIQKACTDDGIEILEEGTY